MNQGQKANVTGIEAEAIISGILLRKGYSIKRQVEVCNSIYGLPVKVDFLVHGVPGYSHGLIIESKWQSSSGSVDEKFPYLVENIRSRYPYPTIIVLAGGGYKLGAEQWLRSQIGGKLLAVMNLEEFVTWITNLAKLAPRLIQTGF